jgi:hypothetical protein
LAVRFRPGAFLSAEGVPLAPSFLAKARKRAAVLSLSKGEVGGSIPPGREISRGLAKPVRAEILKATTPLVGQDAPCYNGPSNGPRVRFIYVVW